MTERDAAASIYDLSFLPGPKGTSLNRRVAKKRARDIGPLCDECRGRQTNLPPVITDKRPL
jgi:hypothetical protein